MCNKLDMFQKIFSVRNETLYRLQHAHLDVSRMMMHFHIVLSMISKIKTTRYKSELQ